MSTLVGKLNARLGTTSGADHLVVVSNPSYTHARLERDEGDGRRSLPLGPAFVPNSELISMLTAMLSMLEIHENMPADPIARQLAVVTIDRDLSAFQAKLSADYATRAAEAAGRAADLARDVGIAVTLPHADAPRRIRELASKAKAAATEAQQLAVQARDIALEAAGKPAPLVLADDVAEEEDVF